MRAGREDRGSSVPGRGRGLFSAVGRRGGVWAAAAVLWGAVGPCGLVALAGPVPLADVRAAAEGGDAEAQHNLGLWLCDGKGVRQDFRAGVRWLEQAAKQGHAKAQADLGNYLYLGGEGVARDRIAAAKWTTKGAVQGIPLAMDHLGYFYLKGEGVARDRVEAYVWYSLAAARGHAEAAESARHARQFLTTRQIQEADRRIATFRPLPASAFLPVVELDRVDIRPPAIAGGAPFRLTAELRVTDLRTIEYILEADFRFRILKDGKEVFLSRARRVQVDNGRAARLTWAGLPSATSPGEYEVEAIVEYGRWRAARMAMLSIRPENPGRREP